MTSTETPLSGTRLTPDEIADRGEKIYRDRLRAQVRAGNVGKYLVIDIDSEDYEIGAEHLPTAKRLRARHPDASLYGMRIGYKAAVSFGGALRPEEEY